MALIGLKAEPIALSPETVDALLKRGNGDAALLYLYLLRRGGDYDRSAAQRELDWNSARVMSAFAHLAELGLAEDDTPPERRNTPDPQSCPEYTREDITAELNASTGFRGLLDEVERLLGKKLSMLELRILMELYDHLALPPEVLVMLTARCIEETEEKYGPGRRPRLSEIKASAYQWKKNGIDTLERADAYLRRQDYLRSQEGGLLRAVGITGRPAIDGERRFLHRWAEWGFGPEAVALAHEVTVLRKGSMVWPYCNGILRRWHEKGLHTPEEIKATEHSQKRRKSGPQQQVQAPGSVPKNAQKNLEWMRRVLAEEEE